MRKEKAASKESKRGDSGPRKRKRPARKIVLNDRDLYALRWMGHQYGVRLDHAQWVLGHAPGRGAAREDWISEGSARDVVKRWEEGNVVRTKVLRAREPFWIWPTRLGLRKVGLPYAYRNFEKASLDDLPHLAAINEIRLQFVDQEEEAKWMSERQLLQDVVWMKGRGVLHRPDGEVQWADGATTAIEAELSAKKPFELAENLMELLRGEEYLRLKEEEGWLLARQMSEGARSRYTEIWYFAPPKIRASVRRERARLVLRGDITQEEAERLFLFWYPLATEEEEEQEGEEDDMLAQVTDEQKRYAEEDE